MKISPFKLIIFILLALFPVIECISQSNIIQPYWRDINIFSINKEYARTEFMTFESRENALNKKFEESSNYKSLNGVWNFIYENDYRNIPNKIEVDCKKIKWRQIKVPGNWEVQGYGTAIYTNIPYDFQPVNPQPPILPDKNPMGVYHKNFQIPGNWKDKNIYLVLDAAKSGVYVYINGYEVGYNEDSKSPAEFLINKYLKAGNNNLTIKILRYSTGSFLECQDFWRISGIERDVYIKAESKIGIKDFNVISTLDNKNINGFFSLNVKLDNNTDKDTQIEFLYELLNKEGNIVCKDSKKIDIDAYKIIDMSFNNDIEKIRAWSSEKPNLYKLLMTVKQNGEIKEIIPFNVGFRKFEIKPTKQIAGNGKPYVCLYINGKAIKIKGVNIHEHNPRTGHYVTEELMRKDFELMKKNNINSVRLCHYPQSRRFYELCDEFGLYVYDEANIESHAMGYDLKKGGTLGNDPNWLQHHLYRTINMYERNKNYPCVSFWSLGNEAGNGYNFYQTYLWIKGKEIKGMNRPVNYERAIWEWNTDMYVPQYPNASWLEEIGKTGSDRPIMPSEYAHAMGNSTGGLWEQWKYIYKYPNLQGGYIWDWVDQGLEAIDKNGNKYWTYGGDYGINVPSDANFLCNGIVNPDRIPHPAMAEVKYSYQNISFEMIDPHNGLFKIFNRFYFTNLKNHSISYNISENGTIIKSGNFQLDINPQESKIIKIKIDDLKPKVNTEYFVNFFVKTIIKEPLIESDYCIAQEQFKLPIEYIKEKFIESTNIKHQKNGDNITIICKNMSFVFNKKNGVVTSYKVNGKELFIDSFGIQPNFWRAPNDNDYGNGEPLRTNIWKQSSKIFNVEDCQFNKNTLKITYLLKAGNKYIVNYHFGKDGKINVNITFKAKNINAEVPRIGVRFRIPSSMEKITYFGKGPEENYIDRSAGSKINEYSSTVANMYHPYVRPQENGHRTEVRYLRLTDKKGNKLTIVADSLIEFNALHNSIEDFDSEENIKRPRQWNNYSKEEIGKRDEEKVMNILRRQTHINDIVPQKYIEVCIDYLQQGVGGYDSWGSRPEQWATINPNREYKWGFTFVFGK